MLVDAADWRYQNSFWNQFCAWKTSSSYAQSIALIKFCWMKNGTSWKECRNQWQCNTPWLLYKKMLLDVSMGMSHFMRFLLCDFTLTWFKNSHHLSNLCDHFHFNTINLLKPTGHVMHHQFNIQQLYALPTLYLCVLYLSENKQRLVPLTA